jgi:hypothetical protein
MKLFDIHHKLTLIFDKEIYTLVLVTYWIHELKTKQIILTDEIRPGRPLINHNDVFILKQLDKIPFDSVRSLSDDLKILKTMV